MYNFMGATCERNLEEHKKINIPTTTVVQVICRENLTAK